MNDISVLQDRLIGEAIGLARASEGNEDLLTPAVHRALWEALLWETDPAVLEARRTQLDGQKRLLAPSCYECMNPCGHNDPYDMENFSKGEGDTPAVKAVILEGLRSLAAQALAAEAAGQSLEEGNAFFYYALSVLGMDHWDAQQYLPVAVKLGQIALQYRALAEK